jgi:hypothetical protein
MFFSQNFVFFWFFRPSYKKDHLYPFRILSEINAFINCFLGR